MISTERTGLEEVARDITVDLSWANDANDVVIRRVGNGSGEVTISLVCMKEHDLGEEYPREECLKGNVCKGKACKGRCPK